MSIYVLLTDFRNSVSNESKRQDEDLKFQQTQIFDRRKILILKQKKYSSIDSNNCIYTSVEQVLFFRVNQLKKIQNHAR